MNEKKANMIIKNYLMTTDSLRHLSFSIDYDGLSDEQCIFVDAVIFFNQQILDIMKIANDNDCIVNFQSSDNLFCTIRFY